MNWYPALPGWDGIHPAMVMFPVALLLVTPVLLLVSLFVRGAWRTWAGAALVTMALGALAAWFAVASGHAAGQLVDKTRTLELAILRHEALGLAVRNVFSVLTVLFAALLLLPMWLRRPLPDWLRITTHAVFLALFVAATGFVAHAADAGGRLVHERGLRAYVVAPPPRDAPASPAERAEEPPPPAPKPPSGARR